MWSLLFCCQRGPWLTVPLIWLHRDFTRLFGVSNHFLSVDMQNKPRSVPSSVGTKECSPSTPTMNSYFYKFMINLLKRFSSERKLLEVRGAFIIRSVLGASLLPRPRIFILTSCNGSRQPWSLLLLQCVMVAERGKSRERRLRRRAWEAEKKPRREGNAGSSEGAGGVGGEPAECSWEWGVVAGKEMREQAQGPQPQRESGVEATLGVVKGLILRRGRKGKEQDGTVPASWEGPPRASW